MAVVDTLRPVGTTLNEWSIVPSGTAHGVLADDSDATYLQDTAPGSVTVTLGAHTVPAGHQRHRTSAGLRALAPTGGSISFSVVAFGTLTNAATVSPPTSTPDVLFAPWTSSNQPSFPSDPLASGSAQFNINALSGAALRAIEAYYFIDSRAQPAFTAEVQDGAGVNRDAGIVTDTSRPVFVFDSPAYDGLVARNWTLEVRTVPGGVVVFTASGTGTPPNVQSDPLPNGDYEADLQISSTIRTNDAYASTVENVTFEVAFVAPASPVLTITPVLTPPAMDVDWTSDAPTATAWDVNADVVTELRRTDCNGTDTVIYVAQTGIGAATYLDRFMSLSYDGVFCGEEDHTCQVCYEARYWGLVDDVLVATDWSTEVCDTVSNPNPGEAWIRGGDSGDLNVCPDESYGLARPFGVFQPIAGGMPTVITATPGGRNYTLSIPTNSEADTVSLLAILAQAIVFYQPVAQADLWLAPDSHSVQVTKVGRNRVVDVPFTAVNPQPVVSPASFF